MSCFNVKFSGQTDITFEIGRNKAYYIRYLKFSACSRCFCIYLLVLDGFRFFDTWHACGFSGLQSCRQNCRELSQTDAKTPQKLSKLHPKSSKMMPRSAPKATLGGSRFQEKYFGAPPEFWGWHFVATWVILGAIWDPAGRQVYPKIEHFGTRKYQKSGKLCPGRGDGKSLKLQWNFDWKMEAWEVQHH